MFDNSHTVVKMGVSVAIAVDVMIRLHVLRSISCPVALSTVKH